jgi:hypothetical protein
LHWLGFGSNEFDPTGHMPYGMRAPYHVGANSFALKCKIKDQF